MNTLLLFGRNLIHYGLKPVKTGFTYCLFGTYIINNNILNVPRFTGKMGDGAKKVVNEYLTVDPEDIRTFSIIAHIDHGKSTLADAMMKYAGNIAQDSPAQFLDNLEVERERGITVKAQTASMILKNPSDGHEYLYNLIDTPGHVDFSYEVYRSLAACQGVLLLVDASQGIQAQTLANYRIAKQYNLDVIPVITKIDLSISNVDKCKEQLESLFGFKEKDILTCSAKKQLGIPEIFDSITNHIMWATGDVTKDLRGRIFDSWYDQFRGIVCSIQIEDGTLSKGDIISFYSNKQTFEVQEIGLLLPFPAPIKQLKPGHIGYAIFGTKDNSLLHIGDTFTHKASLSTITPLPSFPSSNPMVYASIYPVDQSSYEEMKKAVDKLLLNDSSVTISPETSDALGVGFRCGYLGVLHMSIFQERLAKEFEMSVIVTAPFVPHKVLLKTGEEMLIEKAADLPDRARVSKYFQPMTRVTIVSPSQHMGSLMKLLNDKKGRSEDVKYLDKDLVLLQYVVPWGEIVLDLYDKVKNISSGYATIEYEQIGFEEAAISKVDILINGRPVDALSFVCDNKSIETQGRGILVKLQKAINRQQFEVIIQASVGNKIFAKERVAPYRKDVLTKSGKTVGGGDMTRKYKLLEKQKRGKKKMKTVGNVELSQEVFLTVLKRDE
ncbi:hypothetical protein WA158_004907 [Blastocystis sp. Blastoise]